MSLELARKGYWVKGIDISSKSIELAKDTLLKTKKNKEFGLLEYDVISFEKFEPESKYDVIFFCGSLHHMENLPFVIKKANSILKPQGLLYCHEPIHEEFKLKDAAQVALIRTLLSLTGFWYNEKETDFDKSNELCFKKYAEEIRIEYKLERDKHETKGQSPNDLETDGKEILNELKKYFYQLEYQPSTSFIYRVLGGLRGEKKRIFEIADLLATYDRFMTKKGYLSPNYFHYIGRKIEL